MYIIYYIIYINIINIIIIINIFFDTQIQSASSSSLRMLRKKIGATTSFIWSDQSWGHNSQRY